MLILKKEAECGGLPALFNQLSLALDYIDFHMIQLRKNELGCTLSVLIIPMLHIIQKQLRVLILNVILCLIRHKAVIRLQLLQ